MSLLTYLAPPLVGAFIGYATNHVAIRMLFRPLTPWRIFGLRLPMTPGVIPAKRHELAENIGKMVGRHLLTSEDVRHALGQEGFQFELQQLLDNRIAQTLARDLGPVASLVPERFRSYFTVGIKILRWRFLKHLHAHLDGEQVAALLGASIQKQLDLFLAREAGDILPLASRAHLGAMAQETLDRFLASPGLHALVRDLVEEKLATFLKTGGRPRDLLPAALQEALLARLEAETPRLLRQLAAHLGEPAMQDRIARAITGAIQKFTGSLGPMAALLGSFVSPELIDQKVRAYLADKGHDLAGWLLDDAVQEKVAALLREKTRQFLATPLRELLAGVEDEKISQARTWLADLLIAGLRSPAIGKALRELIDKSLAGQQERPLAAILIDLFGAEALTRGREWTAREIVALLRAPKSKRLLDALVVELIEEKLLAAPIGPLAAFLPQEVQNGISDYLLDQVSSLLIREVPDLVDSLNIQQVVARKVNSLDILSLEGLLLSIMEEQFRYINLFGGLLGFLIGLINLLFL
ncbi:DUF445 family protein [Thiovibrio sp. JS02]